MGSSKYSDVAGTEGAWRDLVIQPEISHRLSPNSRFYGKLFQKAIHTAVEGWHTELNDQASSCILPHHRKRILHVCAPPSPIFLPYVTICSFPTLCALSYLRDSSFRMLTQTLFFPTLASLYACLQTWLS